MPPPRHARLRCVRSRRFGAVIDVVLTCADLEPALGYFTDELGFRLDLIFPADAPRIAELSAYGIFLRLEQAERSRQATGREWGTGRAGMQYRDLVPDRLGGRLIASHIRIPAGGPVADYVHHHAVDFQMIYCYRGWVQVVYEDQGPPFVLAAGDCVLQPPHIRHRVLECSDNMEVIEVSSPAEHETRADHEMALPTASVAAAREFRGQRFVRHELRAARWCSGPWNGFESRDTGIANATNGFASAMVVRPLQNAGPMEVDCIKGVAFFFILRGSVSGGASGSEPRQLSAGDAFVVSGNERARIDNGTSDLEILYVLVGSAA